MPFQTLSLSDAEAEFFLMLAFANGSKISLTKMLFLSIEFGHRHHSLVLKCMSSSCTLFSLPLLSPPCSLSSSFRPPGRCSLCDRTIHTGGGSCPRRQLCGNCCCQKLLNKQSIYLCINNNNIDYMPITHNTHPQPRSFTVHTMHRQTHVRGEVMPRSASSFTHTRTDTHTNTRTHIHTHKHASSPTAAAATAATEEKWEGQLRRSPWGRPCTS